MIIGDTFAILKSDWSYKRDNEYILLTSMVSECVVYKDLSHRIDHLFEWIEENRSCGRYIFGYLAYEFGYYTQNIDTKHKLDGNSILAHFVSFSEKSDIDIEDFFTKYCADRSNVGIYDISYDLDYDAYSAKFNNVMENIVSGNVYQVNLTMNMRFKYSGNGIIDLYRALRMQQQPTFESIFVSNSINFISLSPELFVRKMGNKIVCQPMKGTRKRGEESNDMSVIEEMQSDEKTIAENMMIVDLMRSDLSPICEPSSVVVENPFQVVSLKTVYQMISTIRGELIDCISLKDITSAVFPCGSITGAPKISSMNIINELEESPRGIYTGAIFLLDSSGDFCSSVGIRTICINRDKTCNMGIGGGIVSDSKLDDEYNECLLKGNFITRVNDYFQLIETMKFLGNMNAINNFELHMLRLERSAKVFSFKYDLEVISKCINDYKNTLIEDSKIRLLLHRDGSIDLSSRVIEKKLDNFDVIIHPIRIDSNSIFQMHKTTNRDLYDSVFQNVKNDGFFDSLFLSKENQILEFTRGNIFIQKDGILKTPPVSVGIIPGTMRESIIMQNDVREEILYLEDILNADIVYYSNAILGMIQVRIVS